MECKVVVADDEQIIVSAIAYALVREGFQVETAAVDEEALRKVESFHPHVLVLDVMMPKLSGYDVCRKLQDRKDTTILLLTVKNDIVEKLVGLGLGADDYMTKPFDLREVVARVKALCRRLEKNTAVHKRWRALGARRSSIYDDLSTKTIQHNGVKMKI